MKVFLKDQDENYYAADDLLLAVQSKVMRSRFKYNNASEVINLPSIEGEILKSIIAWLQLPQPETLLIQFFALASPGEFSKMLRLSAIIL